MDLDPQAIAQSLEAHLSWLRALIEERLRHYFAAEPPAHFNLPTPPSLDPRAPLDATLLSLDADWTLRAVILLALAPALRPEALDLFLVENTNLKRGFTEFGGLRGRSHGGFLPTLETALFLVAANHLHERIRLLHQLQPDQPLIQRRILQRPDLPNGEPAAAAPLALSHAALAAFMGQPPSSVPPPPNFPASRIQTSLSWDDLVLPNHVLHQVLEIQRWMQHRDRIRLDWGLSKLLHPGFRALFHGPPGTGKSLTAALLGRQLQLHVYRIDLSQVVSKFIGETEKNLGAVFDEAEHHDWILFFDEADALFGRRSTTQSSHDRYANQEVSFLLQRIDDYPGLVILASNFKSNIDDAFVRRLHSIIHFPLPGPQQRLKLWQNALDLPIPKAHDIPLDLLAHDHEVSGADIVNALRSAAIKAASLPNPAIRHQDLLDALRKESIKVGRLPEPSRPSSPSHP